MDIFSLSGVPVLPGVYFFKDDLLAVIYIGKAKSLKSRLQSYKTSAKKDWKIKALIDDHSSIEYVVTHSEIEAALLEAQLIGQYKPKYNVLLKSGQPFLYILFTDEELPKIVLSRNKEKKGLYFGPFLQKSQARNMHRFLIETFQLLHCNKKIENGCLDYHLGRCIGSCLTNFNTKDYLLRFEFAKKVMQKKQKSFLSAVESAIVEYNNQQQYEKSQQLYKYKQDIQIIFDTLHMKYSDDKYFTEFFKVANPAPQLLEQYQKANSELQKIVGITKTITSIDCFDISHFQGHHIVGSCIRYVNGEPDKNSFRKFNIKTLDNQDDYAALQEVVKRRYRDKKNLPDLILIDGGKGQLSSVKKVLTGTPIISLAKREERVFSEIYPQGFVLDLHSSIGKLLTSLRDYAHHFAINHQRSKRQLKKNL